MKSFRLSKPQLNRFNTFGFLALHGHMSESIQEIIDQTVKGLRVS